MQPVVNAETGRLGIPHLKRMWARAQAVRTRGVGQESEDGEADAIVLHGLGLNLLETYRYLFGTPVEFDQFEQWIDES